MEKVWSKYVADFETTVYQNQDKTEVWAAALVKYYTEDVKIFHTIEDFISHLFSLHINLKIKFHNLKFDGSFILYYIMKHLEKKGFELAHNSFGWIPVQDMPRRSYQYSISAKGQWYKILIKRGRQMIEITDSLKLLPFSLRTIGESFQTKHKKLEMKYEGFRYPGCEITKEEEEYIRNDVLVLKEAMEIMEAQGHIKLTIGSCCLDEYKKGLLDKDWNNWFPNLYEHTIDADLYQARNAGQYIRRGYKGGWCYLVPAKAGKVKKKGRTYDVNSLYPSVMHSASGNYYPTGKPAFFSGGIPDKLVNDNARYEHFFYYITIKTHFTIKEGYLPCIQIKNNKLYKATEWLESSAIYIDGQKVMKVMDGDTEVDTRVTLTLSCVDYDLIREHYKLIDCEVLHGCYFVSAIGIFDDYIDKFAKIKQESEGAVRTLAKLYLNNLYGKFATSTDSSYKVAYFNDKGGLSYHTHMEEKKKPGYIAVGAAITAYARCFTITAAQKNYHGPNKPGFIYADTDSIHLDLPEDKVVGVPIHKTKFNHWKMECEWEEAIFTRQKTYIEVTEEGYDVKCAGMPDTCKHLLVRSFNGEGPTEEEIEEEVFNQDELEFLKVRRGLTDFKCGLKIYGKLIPKQIPGGTLLVPGFYEMR